MEFVEDIQVQPSQQPNRQVKDTMFKWLFSKPENQVDLVKSLLGPAYSDITEADITDCTIQQVLVNGIHSDLGLTVRNSLIILTEVQSTNPINCAYRIFQYAAKSYNDWIARNRLVALQYSATQLGLPACMGYVVYTGGEKVPRMLRLRDSIYGGVGPDMQIQVITASSISSLGRNSKLTDYISFCEIQARLVSEGLTGENLVREVIRVCLNNNILKNEISTFKEEVFSIMFEDMTYEEGLRLTGELRYDEGRADTTKLLKDRAKKAGLTPEQYAILFGDSDGRGGVSPLNLGG